MATRLTELIGVETSPIADKIIQVQKGGINQEVTKEQYRLGLPGVDLHKISRVRKTTEILPDKGPVEIEEWKVTAYLTGRDINPDEFIQENRKRFGQFGYKLRQNPQTVFLESLATL